MLTSALTTLFLAVAALAGNQTYELYLPLPSNAPPAGTTVSHEIVIDLTGGPYTTTTVAMTTSDGGGSEWPYGRCRVSAGDVLQVQFTGTSISWPTSPLPTNLWCNGASGGTNYHLKLYPTMFTADYSYSVVSDSAVLPTGEGQLWSLPLPGGHAYPTGIVQCKKADDTTWSNVRAEVVTDAGGAGSDRHVWVKYGAAATEATGYCDIPRTGESAYRINLALDRV